MRYLVILIIGLIIVALISKEEVDHDYEMVGVLSDIKMKDGISDYLIPDDAIGKKVKLTIRLLDKQ